VWSPPAPAARAPPVRIRLYASEQHALPHGAGIEAEQLANIREGKRPSAIVVLHPGPRLAVEPLLPASAGVGAPGGGTDAVFEHGKDQTHFR